jgi:hypothetical protein
MSQAGDSNLCLGLIRQSAHELQIPTISPYLTLEGSLTSTHYSCPLEKLALASPPKGVQEEGEATREHIGDHWIGQSSDLSPVINGIMAHHAMGTPASSDMCVSVVRGPITVLTAEAKEGRRVTSNMWHERVLHPKYLCGFQWDSFGGVACSHTPSVTFTETAPPVPSVPEDDYQHTNVTETISHYPHLFTIVTPICLDAFQELLAHHLNQALVTSMCHGFSHGFWPFANTSSMNSSTPLHYDSMFNIQLLDDKMDFLCNQWNIEIEARQYSACFGSHLLPGMVSPPIFIVPKPHSSKKYCLVNDHSVGAHSPNSFIPVDEGHMCPDNLLDFRCCLHNAVQHYGCPPAYLFKSDVSAAYQCLPLHPHYQIHQIVHFDDGLHIDHCAVFGNHASGHLFCLFFGLVAWIAIHVLGLEDILHYIDD